MPVNRRVCAGRKNGGTDPGNQSLRLNPPCFPYLPFADVSEFAGFLLCRVSNAAPERLPDRAESFRGILQMAGDSTGRKCWWCGANSPKGYSPAVQYSRIQ